MAWGWVNFPANVHFWEKVCKAYLNQVSYLIRFYWDTGGCKINCMDATNYTGCFDACPIHEVTSSRPFIKVVRVNQGRESKQLRVSQDGRAGSQQVCHVTETEWTQSFVWAPGMNPAQVLRKAEGRGAGRQGWREEEGKQYGCLLEFMKQSQRMEHCQGRRHI